MPHAMRFDAGGVARQTIRRVISSGSVIPCDAKLTTFFGDSFEHRIVWIVNIQNRPCAFKRGHHMRNRFWSEDRPADVFSDRHYVLTRGTSGPPGG